MNVSEHICCQQLLTVLMHSHHTYVFFFMTSKVRNCEVCGFFIRSVNMEVKMSWHLCKRVIARHVHHYKEEQ